MSSGPYIKFPLWWGILPEGDINSIARKNVVASDDVHARIPTQNNSTLILIIRSKVIFLMK